MTYNLLKSIQSKQSGKFQNYIKSHQIGLNVSKLAKFTKNNISPNSSNSIGQQLGLVEEKAELCRNRQKCIKNVIDFLIIARYTDCIDIQQRTAR